MNQISVTVRPEYLADQSDAEQGHYAFAYHITIENTGDIPAQLISRHWVITDGNGDKKEVQGPGVVGKQPVITPGEAFTYTSGVVFHTEVGTMEGSYQMIDDDGHSFDAIISPFLLSAPGAIH